MSGGDSSGSADAIKDMKASSASAVKDMKASSASAIKDMKASSAVVKASAADANESAAKVEKDMKVQASAATAYRLDVDLVNITKLFIDRANSYIKSASPAAGLKSSIISAIGDSEKIVDKLSPTSGGGRRKSRSKRRGRQTKKRTGKCQS